MMANILNIVRGGKTAIGKSLFSRLLLSYYSFAELPIYLFDADADLNVQRFYKTDSLALDLSSDWLVDIAGINNDILINLPFNVEGRTNQKTIRIFDSYLIDNKVYSSKFLKRANLKIINWFVSDGTQKSLNYFKFLCKVYGKSQSIVLVKNFGVTNDWADVNDPNSPDSIFDSVMQDYAKSCCMMKLKELRLNYVDVLDRYSIKMDEFLMSSYWSKLRRTYQRRYLLIHYKKLKKILRISDLPITRDNITMQAQNKYGEDFDRDRKW